MTSIAKFPLRHLGGFESLDTEYNYWIDPQNIQGKVPKEIQGTFFRIGPGRNKIGTQKFAHWFDGDGMLNAITFTKQGVHYKNRYVRTPKYVDESKAKRIVYRGFGNKIPGGWRKNIGRMPANCANTNIVFHGNRLLALWEGGRPWQLDPYSLDTIGECSFHQRLKKFSPFSAHGKLDPRTQCYYNFGVMPKLDGKANMVLYKVSPTGHIVQRGRFDLDYFGFCHDFGLTEHYAVFLVTPVAMKTPWPWLLGKQSLDESLDYRPDMGMKAYIVRLQDLTLVSTFILDPCVVVHFSNAWEEAGTLQVDVTHFKDFSVNAALRDVFHSDVCLGGDLWRYSFDLQAHRYEARAHTGLKPCEFPVWDERKTGQKTRIIYSAAVLDNGTPGFFNGLQKYDLNSGEVLIHDFGAGRFTSEPRFVPRNATADEDDGWLLAMVYNADREASEIVVVDAKTLSKEVAVIALQHRVPFGFHGGYVHRAFLPETL